MAHSTNRCKLSQNRIESPHVLNLSAVPKLGLALSLNLLLQLKNSVEKGLSSGRAARHVDVNLKYYIEETAPKNPLVFYLNIHGNFSFQINSDSYGRDQI